ncbi:hypothetical protein SAMN04487843_12656 [Methylobacterium sp. ap11]|nr:hypothetical protein SAMN04487843_12656 [Methylobacterium sp. ap11]
MGTKRHKPEDVVAKLRQADVLIAQGQSVPTTGPGGVRAGRVSLAGCAHPTGSAGQATRGAKADPTLTLKSDHHVGADQPPYAAKL